MTTCVHPVSSTWHIRLATAVLLVRLILPIMAPEIYYWNTISCTDLWSFVTLWLPLSEEEEHSLPFHYQSTVLWFQLRPRWLRPQHWYWVIQLIRVKLWTCTSWLIIYHQFANLLTFILLTNLTFIQINHTMSSTVMSLVNRLLIFIYCRDLCPDQLKENSSSCSSFVA